MLGCLGVAAMGRAPQEPGQAQAAPHLCYMIGCSSGLGPAWQWETRDCRWAVGCFSVTSPLKCSCPSPVPRTVYLLLHGAQLGNDPMTQQEQEVCLIFTPKTFLFHIEEKSIQPGEAGRGLVGCGCTVCAGPWTPTCGAGPGRDQPSNSRGIAFEE